MPAFPGIPILIGGPLTFSASDYHKMSSRVVLYNTRIAIPKSCILHRAVEGHHLNGLLGAIRGDFAALAGKPVLVGCPLTFSTSDDNEMSSRVIYFGIARESQSQ